MSVRRHSHTTKAILALGLLGLAIWFAPSTRADERADDKKSAALPGMVDQDALDHFALQPMNVPVIRDGRVARILTVTVTMETKGGANKTKVMARRYELQDAFIRDLYGIASFQHADGRMIDPRVLKTRLLAISDRILGQGTVENVLVLSIFARNLS